ncbi:MAG: SDR family oxidoreductase [Actinobacteria bacterium]|nr:SDR family oxidoreductase [Actinomycetota bacterium]
MKPEQDLAGKVVVITGAGRGIGRQIAKGAGERGAMVALVELIRENLDSAVNELVAMGIDARGYLTDISNESEINKNFALIEKDFGQIDCLVNNAMIHDPEDLLATSLELWNRTLAVTLTGSFLAIKATLPGMIRRKKGCIINMGTVNAKAMIGSDSYSVAKAGIHALTRTVAVRYGGDGVRCITVVPGTIATDAWQERVDRNPQIFEKLKPWYPLGRVGTPTDVAELVLFLLSDRSQWISGSEFVVDGGLLAGYAPMFKMVEGSD